MFWLISVYTQTVHLFPLKKRLKKEEHMYLFLLPNILGLVSIVLWIFWVGNSGCNPLWPISYSSTLTQTPLFFLFGFCTAVSQSLKLASFQKKKKPQQLPNEQNTRICIRSGCSICSIRIMHMYSVTPVVYKHFMLIYINRMDFKGTNVLNWELHITLLCFAKSQAHVSNTQRAS